MSLFHRQSKEERFKRAFYKYLHDENVTWVGDNSRPVVGGIESLDTRIDDLEKYLKIKKGYIPRKKEDD